MMPSSGPPITASEAMDSVRGVAGQVSLSHPAIAAAMNSGLAKAARTASAREVMVLVRIGANRRVLDWGRDPVLECDHPRMAWDFSTDPEFEAQLDWMRAFVREEIWPIETVFDELGEEGWKRAIRPLQEQVKERGLWAAHLPPDLGGQGFGQVRLGLMHEILGT